MKTRKAYQWCLVAVLTFIAISYGCKKSSCDETIINTEADSMPDYFMQDTIWYVRNAMDTIPFVKMNTVSTTYNYNMQVKDCEQSINVLSYSTYYRCPQFLFKRINERGNLLGSTQIRSYYKLMLGNATFNFDGNYELSGETIGNSIMSNFTVVPAMTINHHLVKDVYHFIGYGKVKNDSIFLYMKGDTLLKWIKYPEQTMYELKYK